MDVIHPKSFFCLSMVAHFSSSYESCFTSTNSSVGNLNFFIKKKNATFLVSSRLEEGFITFEPVSGQMKKYSLQMQLRIFSKIKMYPS